MVRSDPAITPELLRRKLERLFELSARKIWSIEKSWDPSKGTPVFTAAGRYTTRGWTEWTQGFRVGAAILQFDVTNEREFLDLGRRQTIDLMACHVSHVGVHDHGFNNISTYGNLLRLMDEGRVEENAWEREFYTIALKASGAVQAARWTDIADGLGYIYSFNGPHSLFVDTLRSLRSLAVAHKLGHVLVGEHDAKISLLERLVKHAESTARFIVYYGEGRDSYDVRGRTVHEAIFNVNDGRFRCPSTQQGYSPFSTWTRGLGWSILGYAEQLEFLDIVSDEDLSQVGGRTAVESMMLRAAMAGADFYIENTPTDGVPYWDTGAPGLARMGDYLDRPAEPFNDYEPVDSSAAAIIGQGLLRLANYLTRHGDARAALKYRQAALTVANTLLDTPYLSTDDAHQGLLLHSIYHRPNGWDYVPAGSKIPCGESSMWGDHHLRELALMLWREVTGGPYYTFFGPTGKGSR
ncbi:MAG TPA: glycosyl hydrolase [Chloroflexota bacterium]|nr:glycosyl hydrolase [Chloroflexota bacterium]